MVKDKCKLSTKTTATVKNGGFAHFRGTDVNFTISGGIYTIDQSKCMGIRVDNNMYQTGGCLHVTKQHDDAIPIDIKGTDYNEGGQRILD